MKLTKILSTLLVLTLGVGLLTFGAFASSGDVSGGLNLSGGLPTEDTTWTTGGGTITFDVSENTLTLNNAVINVNNSQYKSDAGINLPESVDVEIVLIGSNSITVTDGHGISGGAHTHLTISGESSAELNITVNTKNWAVRAISVAETLNITAAGKIHIEGNGKQGASGFLSTGDITITGADIETRVWGSSISSTKGNITLNDTDLNLTVTTDADWHQQFPTITAGYNKTITVSKMSITEGGRVDSDGNLTVSDGAKVLKSIKSNIVLDNPFVIRTTTDLHEFATLVNSGNSFEGIQVELANSIVFDGLELFTPIGNSVVTPFQGTFDGKGYSVQKLLIATTHSEDVYNGFFGVIGSEGVVKDFVLITPNLWVLQNPTSFDEQHGIGAVASLNQGRIEHVESRGGTVEGYYRVGGIVGTNKGHIENVYNSSIVNGSHHLTGGIVGENYGVINRAVNDNAVKGSYIVDENNDLKHTSEGIGGIAGKNEGGTVINVHNTVNGDVTAISGDITGLNSRDHFSEINARTAANIGGVVGSNFLNDAGVINAYNEGDVSGASSVGGIAGRSFNAFVENVYNKGSVTGAGEHDLGSIVGYNLATVENAYWLNGTASNVVGTNNSSSTAVNVAEFTADGTLSANVDGKIYVNLLDALNAGSELYNSTNPTIEARSWKGFGDDVIFGKLGDVNSDDIVDDKDLRAITNIGRYNEKIQGETSIYDLNGDGIINFADLALARNSKNFGG